MLKFFFTSQLAMLCLSSAGAPVYTPPIDPASGNASAIEWLGSSDLTWKNSYSVSYLSWGEGSISQGLYISNLLYELTPKLKLGFEMGLRNIFQSSGMDPYWDEYRGLSEKPDLVLPRISMQYDFNKSFRFIGMVDLSGGACYSNGGYSGFRSHYMGLNCSPYGRSGFDSFGIDQ
jgi:hypothetical protein